jgi:hypothetical protein
MVNHARSGKIAFLHEATVYAHLWSEGRIKHYARNARLFYNYRNSEKQYLQSDGEISEYQKYSSDQ